MQKIENPIKQTTSKETNVNVSISNSQRDDQRIAWCHHFAWKIETLAVDFDAILTTVFPEKFWKTNFFWSSYPYWKDLSRKNVVVLKFLLKVPKFKENIVICVNTVKKVRKFLLALLQYLRHSFNNEWTQIIFFILPGITRFSLGFASFYIETLHNSIFLYLMFYSKLLFDFFIGSRF